MNFNILETILIVLFLTLLISVLFRHLRLPIILGYLVAGALVGPHALGLISNIHPINELAEFGIVFLLFTIGLDFSLPKLISLKYSVFILGSLQVLITMIITAIVGLWFGMNLISAIVVGGIAAMSSTAVVTKLISEQAELHLKYGINALGILLFQDLSVIPLIILIASLPLTSQQSVILIFLSAVGKSIFSILLIYLLGRKLLQPLFRTISATHISEFFTLTVLLVTLFSAWLTHFLGLSYALGAFLSGIMLSETEFRHQIEIEIRPFRDILVGLFFVTVGMLINTTSWPTTWVWIVWLLIALMIGKSLLIMLLSRVLGDTLHVAFRTGLVLGQGSEFGFVILALALAKGLLPSDYGQVVLSALALSIALAPILIYYNKIIASYLFARLFEREEILAVDEIQTTAKTLKKHIIICGFGRIGQLIARFLEEENYPYIAIDLDEKLVQNARLAGNPIFYADSTHPEILRAVGLSHACALVVSFVDIPSTIKILSFAKEMNSKILILARCKDQVEFEQLKKYGATKIVVGMYEESLKILQYLLQFIHIPPNKISSMIQKIRNKNYELIRKIFPSSYEEEESPTIQLYEQLRPLYINDNSYAVNRRLKELDLHSVGVEVVAIRRGEVKHMKPSDNIKLLTGDISVLSGLPSKLDEAERKILIG